MICDLSILFSFGSVLFFVLGWLFSLGTLVALSILMSVWVSIDFSCGLFGF